MNGVQGCAPKNVLFRVHSQFEKIWVPCLSLQFCRMMAAAASSNFGQPSRKSPWAGWGGGQGGKFIAVKLQSAEYLGNASKKP